MDPAGSYRDFPTAFTVYVPLSKLDIDISVF
jgi:hypothetical protein